MQSLVSLRKGANNETVPALAQVALGGGSGYTLKGALWIEECKLYSFSPRPLSPSPSPAGREKLKGKCERLGGKSMPRIDLLLLRAPQIAQLPAQTISMHTSGYKCGKPESRVWAMIKSQIVVELSKVRLLLLLKAHDWQAHEVR